MMRLLLTFLLLTKLNFCLAEDEAEQNKIDTNQDTSEISEQQKNEISEKSIEQLNLLFNKTYNKSEPELIETGTITPFGAIVSTTGKVNLIRINKEAGATPEKMVRAIQSTMIGLAKKKEIFASAVYYMTENLETTDGNYKRAIIGRLEHASGVSLAIATSIIINANSVNYSPPVTTTISSEVFYWAHQTKVRNKQ
ncbi:hypothetical protein ACFOEK_01065 [Litoribrevibacter euphylliae]|uniref:Uncharacterized protein n=1 Tax=Litoribrevibacter euphylliae TaxID=1834034 RepID=A0ABV7H760_9GAMM